MMISRDNYESFFLDYLEGNLEENKIDQFLDFLEQNPDLKEELQLFENISLPDDNIVFAGKEHLYKSVNEDKPAFEIKAVALMEGDLKDEERQLFEAYLMEHPELQREYDLFTKTKLEADPLIKYPNKHKLYKKSGTTIVLNWVARAAAVIVLAWGINSLIQTKVQPTLPNSVPEIASVKPQTTIPDQKVEPVVPDQQKKPEKQIASTTNQKPLTKRIQNKENLEQKAPVNTIATERDLIKMEELSPILAQLESEPIENQLAISRSINTEKINDPRNIMTVEEFLASRAKKVGDEGLLSVQRIFRTGLNVASELSGDRIGYNVKDGKISSIGYESKLMAFSIPMQKK